MGLWNVLYRRLRWTDACGMTYMLPEPHDYCGGTNCRNVYWEPDDDPKIGELFEQDPAEIPGLTETVLQNLEPASEGDPQDWYCTALFNQQILPWLWDLDNDKVYEKQHSGKWDWQKLMRQLASTGIHEPDDASLKLPLQLRNRRRIWLLLEEARVDDIAAPAKRWKEALAKGEKKARGQQAAIEKHRRETQA